MPVLTLFNTVARWRILLATLCAALAVVCLWTGFDVRFSIKTAAAGQQVEAVILPSSEAAVFSLPSIEALRAGVDTLAVGVSGILESLPSVEARRQVVGKALDQLTFQLGGRAYFTAWDGTRMVHSPLTPDTVNMDFSAAVDVNGRPFILQCKAMVERGGGVMRVSLPLQPSSPDSDADAIEQIAYARPIPGSGWYVIAFVPVGDFAHTSHPLNANDDLRTGLCISGFSFVGLAGAMLVSGPRRREA